MREVWSLMQNAEEVRKPTQVTWQQLATAVALVAVVAAAGSSEETLIALQAQTTVCAVSSTKQLPA